MVNTTMFFKKKTKMKTNKQKNNKMIETDQTTNSQTLNTQHTTHKPTFLNKVNFDQQVHWGSLKTSLISSQFVAWPKILKIKKRQVYNKT